MTWVDVCPFDALTPGRGVCAWLDGDQVAVFLLPDGSLAAIDNIDPTTGVAVLSRGIVGSHTVDGASVPTVASPLHKQRFDLRSGRCLDAEVDVRPWPVRLRAGQIQLARPG